MNPTPHRLDAYFSGQTSPAEERTLAQELANNASLADQFVEQARVDALLGEIFTDQRAGKFHEALVARIMTVEELKPVAKTSPKVIRGPFPYWKQVAAVVAMGLFLWGISSVWYGASQLAEANPRKKTAPRIAGVEAPAVASTDPTPTAVEDRELEAWLRKYFVGTQPLMERSLEDWLVALVEKEFPQHNHLNKHRNLTWEIRATTPESQESLARQNVRLQCAPGSLMDQVRGLAALAGCDVDRPVLGGDVSPVTSEFRGDGQRILPAAGEAVAEERDAVGGHVPLWLGSQALGHGCGADLAGRDRVGR